MISGRTWLDIRSVLVPDVLTYPSNYFTSTVRETNNQIKPLDTHVSFWPRTREEENTNQTQETIMGLNSCVIETYVSWTFRVEIELVAKPLPSMWKSRIGPWCEQGHTSTHWSFAIHQAHVCTYTSWPLLLSPLPPPLPPPALPPLQASKKYKAHSCHEKEPRGASCHCLASIWFPLYLPFLLLDILHGAHGRLEIVFRTSQRREDHQGNSHPNGSGVKKLHFLFFA